MWDRLVGTTPRIIHESADTIMLVVSTIIRTFAALPAGWLIHGGPEATFATLGHMLLVSIPERFAGNAVIRRRVVRRQQTLYRFHLTTRP